MRPLRLFKFFQQQAIKEDETTYQLNNEESLVPVVKTEETGKLSVVDLVDRMLAQAVAWRASDIHLEPQEKVLRVRYRIDGVLKEIETLSKELQLALVSRLKVMANLDITEKRIPQDGRFQLDFDGQKVDCRVSSLPSAFGEKIAIRLLVKETQLLELELLGFYEDNYLRYQKFLQRSHGMVLVTGPAGSGKTTTLYATLNNLNKPEINIMTIEDPVEYMIEGINHVQVNLKAGMHFAKGLRAILRQDPDVIMVGEIRDRETAEIAIRAANTGHLVFSTMHTGDAAGSIARLLEMGIEPYLVASSLIGVVGQRLVRRICQDCQFLYQVPPGASERAYLGIAPDEPLFLKKGTGCSLCLGTGYYDRMAVQEIMPVTANLQNLILGKAPAGEIRAAAAAGGMISLQQDGIRKVRDYLTTVEEVGRWCLVD